MSFLRKATSCLGMVDDGKVFRGDLLGDLATRRRRLQIAAKSCCYPFHRALLMRHPRDNGSITAVLLLSRPAAPSSQTGPAAAYINPNKTESALFPSRPVHPRFQSFRQRRGTRRLTDDPASSRPTPAPSPASPAPNTASRESRWVCMRSWLVREAIASLAVPMIKRWVRKCWRM